MNLEELKELIEIWTIKRDTVIQALGDLEKSYSKIQNNNTYNAMTDLKSKYKIYNSTLSYLNILLNREGQNKEEVFFI